APGEHLRPPARRLGHRHDQAGRHRARRGAGAGRSGLGQPDQADRRGRRYRRSAALRRSRLGPFAGRAVGADPLSAPLSPKAKMWVRAAIDYGPLILFLVVTQFTGNAVTASLAIVPVSVGSLAAAWIMDRRIAPMPLV